MKRYERPLVGFLSREEVEAILDAPDSATWSGRRDRVLWATLYNTGARVSEITALRVDDLTVGSVMSLHIRGKGRKQRTVPLWKSTAKLLRAWLNEIHASLERPLFPTHEVIP